MIGSYYPESPRHSGKACIVDCYAPGDYVSQRHQYPEALDVFAKTLCVHLVRNYAVDMCYTPTGLALVDQDLLVHLDALIPAETVLTLIKDSRHEPMQLYVKPTQLMVATLRR